MRGLHPLLGLCCSVVFFLCFFAPSFSSPHSVQGSEDLICIPGDHGALVGFSRSLASGVPGWTGNVSSNCCLWPGVRCGVSSSANNSGATEARVVGLELWNKTLEGALDGKSLGGLTELRTLNLSKNSLSGNISVELFRLRQLEVLDLSGNLFSGELTDGIRNLSNLRDLDIASNGFSGFIPDAFDGLRKLQLFSARSNNFTGPLPASLSSCSMLTSLDLGNNSLSGSIVVNFTRLVRLRTLRLDSNGFVGHIPGSLSFCRQLEILNLAKNNLHESQIPLRFKHLQALSSLSLSDNGLSNVSRAFAVLSQCRNLTILVLSANFLGEKMPEEYWNGSFESLKVLVVANCALSGSVPSWVRSCAKLRLLDLSSNQLAGGVPEWVGYLTSLFYLDLSNNYLGGVLPDTLAQLKSLTSPATDNSSIEFPFHARRNRSLEVRYSRFSSIPPTLDLSSNGMHGPILSSFGDLTQLIVLNLSKNHFSGSIPLELSGMKSLESLDLSKNNLSGNIPSSLGQLTFLSEFSVAYNNLQGLFLLDGQFSTFPKSSYEGNQGLWCDGPSRWPCGNKPTPDDAPRPPSGFSDVEAFRITFMPLPYGIGVVIGFIPTSIFGFRCIIRRRRRRKAGQD